jgi:NhaA family Na+:H+ antiporter
VAADFDAALVSPVALGTGPGLLVGKPLGILLVCWLVTRIGWARVGPDFSWTQLLGVSFLAGIGFTMALFVNELAFDSTELRQQAKLGILIASLLAGSMGFLILRAAPSPRS